MPEREPYANGTDALQSAMTSLATVLVGKPKIVTQLMTCMLAGGHCLLEDVPGVGKTLLARAMAIVSGCEFRRIQFTPDLLPSDVTGAFVFQPDSRGFEFRPGPIFGQVVLADEINRAAPRTQSALLEAMEESTVTVDGHVHPLPAPFLVLATQNPLDFEATFALPEAQLDRFLMRLTIGYPTEEEELDLLEGKGGKLRLQALQPVWEPSVVLRLQAEANAVHVETGILRLIVQLVHATRSHPSLLLGASPRAGLALLAAARAHALIHNRSYVIPDDVLDLAHCVLSHRLIVRPQVSSRGETADGILQRILKELPIPGIPTASSSGAQP